MPKTQNFSNFKKCKTKRYSAAKFHTTIKTRFESLSSNISKNIKLGTSVISQLNEIE